MSCRRKGSHFVGGGGFMHWVLRRGDVEVLTDGDPHFLMERSSPSPMGLTQQHFIQARKEGLPGGWVYREGTGYSLRGYPNRTLKIASYAGVHHDYLVAASPFTGEMGVERKTRNAPVPVWLRARTVSTLAEAHATVGLFEQHQFSDVVLGYLSDSTWGWKHVEEVAAAVRASTMIKLNAKWDDEGAVLRWQRLIFCNGHVSGWVNSEGEARVTIQVLGEGDVKVVISKTTLEVLTQMLTSHADGLPFWLKVEIFLA